MFDQVFGLPMHALVIHAVVVFVPLTALTALVYAVVPRWRWLLRWPLLVGSAASFAAGFVARQSGIALYDRLNSPSVAATHASLGLLLFWFLLVFFVVSVAAVFMLGGPSPLPGGRVWRGAARPVQLVVAVLLVVAAVGVSVQVVRTGDAGARAVWAPQSQGQ